MQKALHMFDICVLGHVPETSQKCGARISFTALLVCVWSFASTWLQGKPWLKTPWLQSPRNSPQTCFSPWTPPYMKAGNCRVFFRFCCLRCYSWVSKARIEINDQNISKQYILASSCITRFHHLPCLVSTSNSTERKWVWGLGANGNWPKPAVHPLDSFGVSSFLWVWTALTGFGVCVSDGLLRAAPASSF